MSELPEGILVVGLWELRIGETSLYGELRDS